jgi:hypothetical protein
MTFLLDLSPCFEVDIGRPRLLRERGLVPDSATEIESDSMVLEAAKTVCSI